MSEHGLASTTGVAVAVLLVLFIAALVVGAVQWWWWWHSKDHRSGADSARLLLQQQQLVNRTGSLLPWVSSRRVHLAVCGFYVQADADTLYQALLTARVDRATTFVFFQQTGQLMDEATGRFLAWNTVDLPPLPGQMFSPGRGFLTRYLQVDPASGAALPTAGCEPLQWTAQMWHALGRDSAIAAQGAAPSLFSSGSGESESQATSSPRLLIFGILWMSSSATLAVGPADTLRPTMSKSPLNATILPTPWTVSGMSLSATVPMLPRGQLWQLLPIPSSSSEAPMNVASPTSGYQKWTSLAAGSQTILGPGLYLDASTSLQVPGSSTSAFGIAPTTAQGQTGIVFGSSGWWEATGAAYIFLYQGVLVCTNKDNVLLYFTPNSVPANLVQLTALDSSGSGSGSLGVVVSTQVQLLSSASALSAVVWSSASLFSIAGS